MAFQPYQHQKDGAIAIERFGGRCLVGDDQGLGKSAQALLWARRNPDIRPIVVVCPASMKYTWAREAAVHFNMRSEVLEGMKVPKQGFVTPHPLVILNYRILGPWLKFLTSLKPQLVIIDEAQALCNRLSQQSKNTKALCHGVPHVLALSGTPLVNRPAELWQILNILRPDRFPKFFPFAQEFTIPELKRWGWTFNGAKNLDRLHKILVNEVMIRRLKKDVLKDLPAKRYMAVSMKMEDEKEYRRAVKDFIQWLGGIDPARARRAMRAEQIAKLTYLRGLVGKLKTASVCQWVDEFLASTQEKLILFALHKEVISTLVERYKSLSVVVDGSVTGRNRQVAVDQFQRDKKVRLFIGNVKAAGQGLTLTAASTVAFAEYPWTPGDLVQCEDRAHRIGQTKEVNIYYLVAHNSIEDKILRLIQEKKSVLDQVLDGGGRSEDLDLYDLVSFALKEELRRESAVQ